jgi:hypothetical protein
MKSPDRASVAGYQTLIWIGRPNPEEFLRDSSRRFSTVKPTEYFPFCRLPQSFGAGCDWQGEAVSKIALQASALVMRSEHRNIAA